MTMHIRIIINFLLIGFILFGCQNKTEQISKLINDGKFVEAQALINKLSPQEKSTTEIKLLASKAEFGILLLTATDLVNKKDYEKAYSCLIKADKITRLNDEGIRLLEETRKQIISGLWLGSLDKGNKKIKIKLTALTGSTFDGVAIIEKAVFNNPILGGFFDGNELSAILEFHYNIPINKNAGSLNSRQIVGFRPSIENFTMSGNISDGVMKIAIKEINTVSHWTLKKKMD